MKRFLCCLLLLALLCPLAVAEGGALRVVTTVFALYDWTRAVTDGVDSVEVTFLLADGVDMHSYQPAVPDMMALTDSDLFICVGGESDEWALELLEQSGRGDHCLRLLEALGDRAVTEELREGMQAEEEEPGELEWDEHIWLSLKNARALVPVIAEALAGADPVHAEAYRANAAAYCLKLEAVDGRYAEMVAAAPRDTVLIADRFPFRYLTEDYYLNWYAAFLGCAAESEASFDTIAYLVGKVDELDLDTILTIETGDRRLAEAIVANSRDRDQQILTLNSMQGVTGEQVEEGLTYLQGMEDDLEVLRHALGA